MSQSKQQWGSRLGVILAVSGSAVGLGNFLRFPGQAAQNGGGAFLIPYFIALLLLGIPIGWAEWTMGRYGGRKGFHSAPAIMGVWGKGAAARFMGAFGVLIPLAVYFYYVMIESWCLTYAVDFARGAVGITEGLAIGEQSVESAAYFDAVSGAAANGFTLDGAIPRSTWFWIVTTVVNLFFIFRGLSEGIEKFCRLAMPAMAICAFIVLIRVLTLGTPDPAYPDRSVADGLNFMWDPNWEKLWDFQTWLAAGGQVFFTLSVGFGVIINYASYMRKKDDVVLSGLTAASTNEFFEVALGGMITLTASVIILGASATADASTSGFALGFKSLAVVFQHMPLGNLVGATWFFMLFLAAITSSLSMLQPTKAFFEEALGLSRNAATVFVAVICLAGNAFVLYFSEGLTALDTIDFWVGTFMIFVVAGTQIICFGWIFGVDKGLEEAHKGAQMRIPGIFRFIIKYVSPVYLIVIFGGFLLQSLPDSTDKETGEVSAGWLTRISENSTIQLSLGLIAAVIVLLLVTTAIGAKRWRAAGLDLDGEHPATEGDGAS